MARTTPPRLIRRIEELGATDHGDVVPLEGQAGCWRLRVGDWHVLFTYGEVGELVILRALPRGRAYR